MLISVVRDFTAPSAPTSVVGTAQSATSILLSWGAVSDFSGISEYRVERGTDGTAFTQIGTSATTSYSDTALISGTLYYYRIRAVDGAGNIGPYSSVISTRPGNAPPVWSAIPAQNVTASVLSTINIATYATDPEGSPLTFGRTNTVNDTAPSGVTVSSTGVVSVSASVPAGTYQVEVFADDVGQSTAASDWLARSTAPGVVWAHDFSYDAEVTAHLGSNTAQLTGAPVRRVLDSSGAYCLEQMSIGATLAQEFLAAGGAGPRTMVVNDASDWPASDFYFFVTKKHPNIVGSKICFIARRALATL